MENTAIFCPNCFRSGGYISGVCRACGYKQDVRKESRALSPGILLNNRYHVGRILGIGGFGITYLVFDRQLRLRCAIKEYFPAQWSYRSAQSGAIEPSSETTEGLYQHGKKVFEDEANILLNLQKEKTVVDVWDFFEENGTAYLVMEYIDGMTLSRYVKEKGSLRLDTANRVLQDMADALYRIHKRMLLHRDISPDNIMMDRDGGFKLIDFGATRAYALNEPSSLSVLVKAGFAPIEQYSKSGNQGPWSDVYALAATYYYLLSGHKPPAAPDREMRDEFKALSYYVPGISARIDNAITRALSCKWAERPGDMKEFVTDMGLQHRIQQVGATPRLILQVPGSTESREWDLTGKSITIGRDPRRCEICFRNRQISGLHAEISFDQGSGSFILTNHSSTNVVFTTRGVIQTGQRVQMLQGEWFCLQTNERRYVFYVEVR